MNKDFDYVKVEDEGELSLAIAKKILNLTNKKQKVFWLISGGTSIPIAVHVTKYLGVINPNLLRVGIVDEKITKRHLQISNWEQLKVAGFHVDGIKPLRILHSNKTIEECAIEYSRLLVKNLRWADVSIGQFGIGAGYHTGGILSGSPAVSSNEFVVAYETEDEEHITITVKAINQLDMVIINSIGESKRELVAHFVESDADPVNEPTQALKVKGRSVLYTDVYPEID